MLLIFWVISPLFLLNYWFDQNANFYTAHYLNIYISQKIRLCNWFGRPISNQPTGQNYEVFDLKIQIYYTDFPSIFCRSCQIHCFLHTVAAIPKRLKYLSYILQFSTWQNSRNSVQQAVDLTTTAKNRRKWV